MPNVKFHLVVDGELFPDTVGQDVPDLKVAHSRARALTAKLMTLCDRFPQAGREGCWVVHVQDETGRTPLSVIFAPGTRDAADKRRASAQR